MKADSDSGTAFARIRTGGISDVSVCTADVQRMAVLAGLELSPTEEAELITHFNTLLAYFEQLKQLDTDGVEPLINPLEGPGPMRDDRITNQPNPDALLQNAPAREDGFFKVPPIIPSKETRL